MYDVHTEPGRAKTKAPADSTGETESHLRDLNPKPAAYDAAALPIELRWQTAALGTGKYSIGEFFWQTCPSDAASTARKTKTHTACASAFLQPGRAIYRLARRTPRRFRRLRVFLQPQVRLAHALHFTDLFRLALRFEMAVVQDVRVIADGERHLHVLLDEEHRQSLGL